MPTQALITESKEKADERTAAHVEWLLSEAAPSYEGEIDALRHALMFIHRPRACRHGVYQDPSGDIVCDTCLSECQNNCWICNRPNPQAPRVDCDECRIQGATERLEKLGYTVTAPEIHA